MPILNRRRRVVVAAVTLTAAGWAGVRSAAVRADDQPTTAPAAQIENPLYKGWANQKPGSTTTLGLDTDSPMGKAHVDMTFTLVSVDADGAKVSVGGKINLGGKTMASPAKEQTIPAKVSADDAKAVAGQDVDAMGKTFKCKGYEVKPAAMGSTPPAGAKPQAATLYLSDDVPGALVKLEATDPMGRKQSAVLTSFEAK